MHSNKLENRGNSGLLDIWWSSIFTTASTLLAKDGDKVSKWDLENTKRDVKTERFGVEFEQQAMGSLQLLALMRIITPVITLAYLREWRGRTSACARVCVWVGMRACVHAVCVCACMAVRVPFLLSHLQSLPHSLNLNISLLAHNNCVWASYPPYQIRVCTR